MLFRGSCTSQSAAAVGAAAALILEDRPELTPDQVKWLLMTTARPLPKAADWAQGAGVIDVAAAVLRPADQATAQAWPQATGTGTLEGARGTYHVADSDGVVLQGEVALPSGVSWSGVSWSGVSWSGVSWSGGEWSGVSWSGGEWLGVSWSGVSWSGVSWSGVSWSGVSWSGVSWSGVSWSGVSWSGVSWSSATSEP